MKRREFLKTTVAGAAMGVTAPLPAEGPMPMRTLGKSGLRVSLMCLGGADMGYRAKPDAIRLIHRSMDLGINFFDSAHKYHDGKSDSLYGDAFQGGLRKKVLLMSKAQLRDEASAAKQLDETLRRMKTDYLDLWQCHEVSHMEEVEKIYGPKGALEAFVKAKKQGKVRHIGFTGHRDPEVHLAMLNGFDGWETVQHPVNPIDPHYRSFVKNVLPKVGAKGLGKIAMKTAAAGAIKEHNVATYTECLRYAMSQNPDTIVSGVQTIEQLEENVSVIKHLGPFSDEEVRQLVARTSKGPLGAEVEGYKRKEA